MCCSVLEVKEFAYFERKVTANCGVRETREAWCSRPRPSLPNNSIGKGIRQNSLRSEVFLFMYLKLERSHNRKRRVSVLNHQGGFGDANNQEEQNDGPQTHDEYSVEVRNVQDVRHAAYK